MQARCGRTVHHQHSLWRLLVSGQEVSKGTVRRSGIEGIEQHLNSYVSSCPVHNHKFALDALG